MNATRRSTGARAWQASSVLACRSAPARANDAQRHGQGHIPNQIAVYVTKKSAAELYSVYEVAVAVNEEKGMSVLVGSVVHTVV